MEEQWIREIQRKVSRTAADHLIRAHYDEIYRFVYRQTGHKEDAMDLTQSGLSYHMKILCDSGLVVSRQEGKWTHYRLSASGRERAVELLRTLTTPDAEQEGNCPKCGG